MNKKLKEATKQEISAAYMNDAPKLVSRIRREHKEYFTDMRTGEVISLNGFNIYVAQKINKGFEFRVWRSERQRKQRIRKRIKSYIATGRAQFITLTFNDNFLAREISEDTRRRYIARFLKKECDYYIANKDYGEDNGREHYHAVIVPKNACIDYSSYNEAFDKSRIYAENIKVADKSSSCIARYINKLTNHSLKVKGSYQRLIYSRK